MKIVSAQEMRGIDQRAIQEYGISSLILMENAGVRVVEVANTFLENKSNPLVAVVAGKGNNGGDGLVVARHLINSGARVEIFVSGNLQEMTPDCQVNYEILMKMRASIYLLPAEEAISQLTISALAADLIIDAMYGISFHGRLGEDDARIVSILNRSGKPIVAIDIPSGVEADSGKVFGEAIRAAWTVTLALPKMGILVEPGRSHAGRVTVADISIPSILMSDPVLKQNLLTEEMVTGFFPPRPHESHKGTFGHTIVVGGSVGMTGAVALASAAALSVGAGLVTAAVPESLAPIVEGALVEVMTIPLPENRYKSIAEESLPVIETLLERASVCAIGPGLSRYAEAGAIVRFILERSGVPIVIDADGLNALCEDNSILSKRQVPIVLTPHPGEMARLLGKTVEYVQSNRLKVAREAAMEWGVTIVLKGANTVVAEPGGELYLNITGNPGMATAGSGDVLTGVISGLISQGLRPNVAASIGVYIHGKAGNLVKERNGERGLVAGDMIRALTEVIKGFEDQFMDSY
ncbi:MAG: NAD(P)H-hydrate dehydratase [Syntrophomonadaceae bacterium]|nr:NAD(P)H-hydrate dehydratase [Syntrophomonadaceae bacterium]